MIRIESFLAALTVATVLLLHPSTGEAAPRLHPPLARGAATGETRWDFGHTTAGAVPQHVDVLSGVWAVREEPDAPSPFNALCQTGEARYAAVVLGKDSYADLTVTAFFKPISGKEDRAGGIIFRVQDNGDYYVVRANALENNVNIYRYLRGNRELLREGNVNVSPGVWQELKVEAQGRHIRGYLNGKKVVEADDAALGAGRVGLWTKADSVTCFDDVRIEPR